MRYTKMHGAGNSFVLIESLRGELTGEDLNGLARRLCREHGTDGLIVLVPAAEADFGMLFFNADGTAGEMCGNGARCLARYGAEHGLARDAEDIRILSAAGLVHGRRIDGTLYEVRLNDPSVIDLHRCAAADGESFDCVYVELGDPGIPHAVVECALSDFDDLASLRRRGRALRYAPVFPKGANVTFACVTGPRQVRAITYERGVEDFTLACGTGCGATALGLLLRGRIAEGPIGIDMPGGHLRVALRREGDTVRDLFLTGPTAVVEEGLFSL